MFNPPLMCMDLLKIREQIQVLNLHTDFYHIDIMDDHFVKNITLSPDFVRVVARVSRVSLGCHLMVTHPDDYIAMLTQIGTTFLPPHAETINMDAFRILHKVHEFGCRTGIVLNPTIPLSYIRHCLRLLDKIAITGVGPDLVGQALVREMLDKIKEAKTLKLQHGYWCLIEVDGPCNAATFQGLRQAGVEVSIVGDSGLLQLDDSLHMAWEKMFAQFHGEIDKTQHSREQL